MNKKIKKLSELSVFFPAYNEAANIEETIKQALFVVPRLAKKYEIIVVNDGSTDSTYQIAKRLAKRHKYVRVVTQKNKGYGGALKRGFSTAKYEWVFFTDADLQFDLHELEKFVAVAADNDMVIGYRKNRAEGRKREVLAKLLRVWNKILFNFPLSIKDIDCAFKLIKKSVIKEVEPLFSDGAMASTELLLKAYKAHFVYEQIGVTHYKRRAGEPTGDNFSVIARAVKDTFMLRKVLIAKSPAGRFLLSSLYSFVHSVREFALVMRS